MRDCASLYKCLLWLALLISFLLLCLLISLFPVDCKHDLLFHLYCHILFELFADLELRIFVDPV